MNQVTYYAYDVPAYHKLQVTTCNFWVTVSVVSTYLLSFRTPSTPTLQDSSSHSVQDVPGGFPESLQSVAGQMPPPRLYCALACLAWLAGVCPEVLTPPYFNIAEKRKVEASYTCGVDVQEPELYCKLVGAQQDYYDLDKTIISGQVSANYLICIDAD